MTKMPSLQALLETEVAIEFVGAEKPVKLRLIAVEAAGIWTDDSVTIVLDLDEDGRTAASFEAGGACFHPFPSIKRLAPAR